MKKAAPIIMGIVGFLLMMPIFLGGAILKTLATKAGMETTSTVIFLTIQLPSLVGFVASLGSLAAPKVAGAFMLIAGIIILIPGIIFTSGIFGGFTGALYIGAGLLLIFQKRQTKPLKKG